MQHQERDRNQPLKPPRRLRELQQALRLRSLDAPVRQGEAGQTLLDLVSEALVA